MDSIVSVRPVTHIPEVSKGLSLKGMEEVIVTEDGNIFLKNIAERDAETARCGEDDLMEHEVDDVDIHQQEESMEEAKVNARKAPMEPT